MNGSRKRPAARLEHSPNLDPSFVWGWIHAVLMLAGLLYLGVLGVWAAPVYQIDFENGVVKAKTGGAKAEISANGNLGGAVLVVDNPKKDYRNPSQKVAWSHAAKGYIRAEVSSQRIPTAGKTYVYKWSYLFPEDFFKDATMKWLIASQWKSYPCGFHDGYDKEICPSCGIFNDIHLLTKEKEIEFRWRAMPDCKHHSIPLPLGEWIDFQQEIKWTNQTNGYSKLWMNGKLVHEEKDIKTLMD